MSYLSRAEGVLLAIREEHRYRELPERQIAADVIDFSSNDYLGMATDPQVVEALKHASRVGSGGARLLAGRHRELSLLEEELASWLGRERALLFSSGYLAAAGTIPALAEVVETIRSDESNHASLVDGIRLAHKPYTIYEHATLPPAHAAKSALVVSESLFSMDGDFIDAPALVRALGENDVLLVDEAHALGVAGPEGGGVARTLGDPRLVILGTLSKALGGLGGFVAGPAAVVDLLVNRARTFIFDTALPPALALAARVALHLTRKADDRRERLRANVMLLRAILRRPLDGVYPERSNVMVSPSTPLRINSAMSSRAESRDEPRGTRGDMQSPIVSIVLGGEEEAVRVSRRLLERRIFLPAIRPPTVPPGTSRLRVSVRADHMPEQVELLASELQRCIAIS